MKIEVTLYKDEFTTHKVVNAMILEEVLKRLPSEGDTESAELNEERSALFDTLLEQVNVGIDEFLKADLKRTLDVTFNPHLSITEVKDGCSLTINSKKVS